MVTRHDIVKRGGKGLFTYYDSVEGLLRSCYPDTQWDALSWRKKAQSGDVNYQRQVLDNIGKELGVNKVLPFSHKKS